MNIELNSAHCFVEPHRIIISPQYKTGWEIVVSQVKQEVLKQYRLFGLILPWQHRIPFSNIATIRAIRTDISVYEGTSLKEKINHSMQLWQFSEQESFVGQERKGFRHSLIIITKHGKTCSIVSGTTTWDDLESGNAMSPGIAHLHELLRQMIDNH
ncbi:hypothetical protein ACFLU3_01940 [Chloroflexota bacterium]